MTDSIPKEHLQQWLTDPITRKVFDVLRKTRDDHKDLLCDGGTLNLSSSEHTSLQTTLLLGKIAGLNMLLEIKVDSED